MTTSAKTAVRRYFDQEVDGYLDAYRTPRTGDSRQDVFLERRDLVLEMTPPAATQILDIGAGPGVFTAPLLARGASCCVVDLSYEMIATARRYVGAPRRASFVVGDLDRLPFADGSFDAALCVGVLQYLPSLEFAFAELARVIAPGGALVLTFPNARSPLNRLHRLAIGGARGARAIAERLGLVASAADASRLTFRPDIPNRWFSAGEIERFGSAAGFSPDGEIYHALQFPFSVPGFGWATRGWNRAARGRRLTGPLASWGREGIVRLKRQG